MTKAHFNVEGGLGSQPQQGALLGARLAGPRAVPCGIQGPPADRFAPLITAGSWGQGQSWHGHQAGGRGGPGGFGRGQDLAHSPSSIHPSFFPPFAPALAKE